MSLHWLMAFLIFALFCVGWYMGDLPKGSDERSYFFRLHKSIGLTVFLLLFLRLSWAIIRKPPVLPASIANWQRKLATVAHRSLYILMFIQPITGFISASFSGYKTKFWGIFTMPQWAEKDKEWNAIFSEIHEATSIILLIIILIHIAGALAFLLSNHENVLKRMLPWRDKSADSQSG